MNKSETQAGAFEAPEKNFVHPCVGCIDFAIYHGMCDYLLNQGHCRPVPRGPKGCVLKARTRAQREKLEEKYRWDPAAAIEMVKNGIPIAEVGKQLHASTNAIKALLVNGDSSGFIAGMPWKRLEQKTESRTPDKPKRRPAVWIREKEFLELYNKGLMDHQVAEEMGLCYMTICKHRNRLGLPPNRYRNKRGALNDEAK